MDYKIGYLLIMVLIAAAVAYFVYRESKSKKRTLWAFALTFVVITAVYSIKYY